jgi:hypothetical protein
MNHADVLHALREAGRADNSLGDGYSNSMDRLSDAQVYVWCMNIMQAAKHE